MSNVLGTSHKKIAIVGSAPSSVSLAPYADSDWEIWACSPGVFGVAARTNIYFEMHRFHSAEPGRSGAAGTVPHFSPEYTAFLRTYHDRVNVGTPKVLMSEQLDDIPCSERYPFEDIIEKYGNYHWSSTVAWMLALAIEQEPDEIGLWGVDMAAQEEYLKQRGDCQHFIRIAKEKGIKITIPRESDLMRPMFRYGLDEYSPMGIKIKSRITEFNARLANNKAQQEGLKQEETFLMGALDDAKYMLAFWTTEEAHSEVAKEATSVGFRKETIGDFTFHVAGHRKDGGNITVQCCKCNKSMCQSFTTYDINNDEYTCYECK